MMIGDQGAVVGDQHVGAVDDADDAPGFGAVDDRQMFGLFGVHHLEEAFEAVVGERRGAVLACDVLGVDDAVGAVGEGEFAELIEGQRAAQPGVAIEDEEDAVGIDAQQLANLVDLHLARDAAHGVVHHLAHRHGLQQTGGAVARDVDAAPLEHSVEV